MNTSDPETSAIADTRLSARTKYGLAAAFLMAVLAVCAAIIISAAAFRDGQPHAVGFAIAALAATVVAGLLAIAARWSKIAERYLGVGLCACVIALAAIAPQAAIIDFDSGGALGLVIAVVVYVIGLFLLHLLTAWDQPLAHEFAVPPDRRVRTHERNFVVLAALVLSIFAFLISISQPLAPLFAPDMGVFRWSEGKTGAGIIRQALDVYRAKNGGKLSGISVGPALDHADKLRLDPAPFAKLKYFNADDFRIAAIDTEAGTYTLSVTGTHPDSPSGTYTLDSDGNETGP